MLFNSIQFAVFFPVVTGLYFALPHRWRWILLLTASCYFYMAFVPIYIIILCLTIVVDYFAGLFIAGSEGRRRRLFLILSLITNLGILGVFKYYNFFISSIAEVGRAVGSPFALPALSLLLPIGLSFHTFQAMSYTIEVYRGRQPPERHFGIYALYVMFYPQLVAGPIERPQHLLHQFREVHQFDGARVRRGLTLMAWGLLKKVVIADRLAPIIDLAYTHPGDYSGAALALATIGFAFQIYCDFSGYSDMALGSAEVMGFRLIRNFNSPYLAPSTADFWRRWHISLSSWFRDYLFLPLSYRLMRAFERDVRLGVGGDVWVYGAATMITMFLCGLWHGAAWTFVIWGLLHGFYLSFGFATRRVREQAVTRATGWLPAAVVTSGRVVVTFLLVCVAWVFFRAPSVHAAGEILSKSVAGWRGVPGTRVLLDDPASGLWLALLLAVVLWVEEKEPRHDARAWLAARPPMVRWMVYSAMGLTILLFGQLDQQQPFIYFQF
jgi:alginate O-acetyltransferase complex protein AlgI